MDLIYSTKSYKFKQSLHFYAYLNEGVVLQSRYSTHLFPPEQRKFDKKL